MKLLKLLTTSIMFCAAISASALEEGVDYIVAPGGAPKPLSGKQIKVTEFFNFSCPACNASQPYIEEWLTTKPEDVNWTRHPVIFSRWNGLYAEAYFVLEAFNKAELATKLFRAIHIEKKLLNSKGRIAGWLAENHGLDEDKVEEAFDSFAVSTKMRKAKRVLENLNINSTPTFVVADRYIIVNSNAGSYEQIFENLSELIEKVRAGTAG